MKKISNIIYLILKILIGLFFTLGVLIFTFLLYRFIDWYFIDSYKYRTKVVNDYLSRNIIMDRNNISGGQLNPLAGIEVRSIEFTDNKEYKNKYIKIDDPEKSIDSFYLLGLEKYIGDNLVHDKSKGNHFDKIEEYLQKNKERIFDIFLSNQNSKGVRIYFEMDIMYKLQNGDLYTSYGLKMKINNHIIKSLKEYDEENYVENKEKGFFKEKVKYEDIDWKKYIEYMEVYPVLFMNVEYKDSKSSKDDTYSHKIWANSRNSEKLLEIYKEMEKFYNKKTFNFAIRK